jgi:hypothetical protein
MTERPLLLEDDLPREAGDIADACASVPSSSGYRAVLQTLLRGKMSGAAIALVLRQVVVMALSVSSSVAVSRWLGLSSKYSDFFSHTVSVLVKWR